MIVTLKNCWSNDRAASALRARLEPVVVHALRLAGHLRGVFPGTETVLAVMGFRGVDRVDRLSFRVAAICKVLPDRPMVTALLFEGGNAAATLRTRDADDADKNDARLGEAGVLKA